MNAENNVDVAVTARHIHRINAENRVEYIHQLTAWPKFEWNDAKLLPLLADIRHKQGFLLGRMQGLGFRLRNEANLSTLTADVIKSSEIEGEKLDPEQVRSSIARRLGLEFAGTATPSRNVEGVVEMMLNATQEYDSPMTKKRLFGWHAALFPTGHSGIHKITVGAWRKPEDDPMQVISGPEGRKTVHFEAPRAECLEKEMTAFLAWFESSDIDPVLKSAIAHLWYVTVHPFEDGNGRIARAIADMALARSDGTSERFYSMSAQIETERDEYYDQLEATQKGSLDITPWLMWFLECLRRAIENAEKQLGAALDKTKVWERIGPSLVNERQRNVINRLLDGFIGKLTSSKYAKLAKCSPDTALRDINDLLERGVLIRDEGGGRSTSYSLASSQPLSSATGNQAL
jgi:Fic family protein